MVSATIKLKVNEKEFELTMDEINVLREYLNENFTKDSPPAWLPRYPDKMGPPMYGPSFGDSGDSRKMDTPRTFITSSIKTPFE